jgi:hypothetical protein
MRFYRLSAALVPLVSFASWLLPGCSSDDNTAAPRTDAGLDAGLPGDAEPTADATLPDSTPPVEAAAPGADAGDATADVAEEPPPPGSVTVFVREPSGPVSGVTVVIDDATGAFLSQATTDANGTVVQMVPPNGMVTSIFTLLPYTIPGEELLTVTGVQPGDTLTEIDNVDPTTHSMKVFAPPSPPAGTDTLVARMGESGGGTAFDGGTPAISIYEFPWWTPYDATPTGSFSILTLAVGGADTLGFTFQKGLQVPTGPVPTGGIAPEITMNGPWQTQFGEETVSPTNVPSGFAPYAILEHYVGDVPYVDKKFVDGGAVFVTYPGYADFLQAEVQLNNETAQTSQAVAVRTSAPASGPGTGTLSVDMSTALPAITGVTVDATNPVRPSATVVAATPLTGAAGMFVTLDWMEVTDGGGEVGTLQSGRWLIACPPSASAIQYPSLGDAAGAPLPNVRWSVGSAVAVGGSAFPSYGSVRSAASYFGNQQLQERAPILPALAANGTMSATLFY